MRSYKYFYNSNDAVVSSSNANDYWSNFTKNYYASNNDDFTSQFNAAKDVPVDAVLTSIYLNSIAFVVLMCTYECLRRLLPSVYSSQIKRQYKNYGGWTSTAGRTDTQDSAELNFSGKGATAGAGLGRDGDGDGDASSGEGGMLGTPSVDRETSLAQLRSYSNSFMLPEYSSLPDVITSFNWVAGVFSVSWDTIRKYSGLDGYFFLRYIRMNLRICFVTAVWAFIILVPTYATGENNNQKGWYHLSVANVLSGSSRMWIPSIFAYLFTGFIFFVMKQEYRHFLELRMDFLARGTSYIHPQHHYSLIVENIPHELRSEKALADYFESLFPGKVHSASMVLNLPDLETVAARCMRVCRRLEKSIAYYHDTGKRATHNVGSPRIRILGIDMAPCDFGCCATPNVAYVDNRDSMEKPEKGTHVDSISYYTYDLAETNKELHAMQTRKVEMAFVGSSYVDAENWITKLMVAAYEMADEIMIDSAEDNALRTSYSSTSEKGISIPQAELMSTRTLYGTLGVGETARTAQCGQYANRNDSIFLPSDDGLLRSASSQLDDNENGSMSSGSHGSKLLEKAISKRRKNLSTPGKSKSSNMFRRIAGRLGLDFVVAGVKFANHQLDHAVEGVVGATMSSTGFVTFLDLTSVTTAASAPLTSKPQTLDVAVAPEPRDIIWQNAHISQRSQHRRENSTNIFLVVVGFLWIFPLAAIQAFAKADYIAQIPGMEWILTAGGGRVSQFVNGYLPVVALLCLIMILPVIFEVLARSHERRKTLSDVQNSMLGRYFYFQVLNLYISVTAGSLWKSLSEILDRPSSLFTLLGESLPFMVGYFVALLVTKILAGLPMVFLRIGALSKMLLRRTLSSAGKLTQRELDEMYRPENVQYGWEFPAQLLVIMIVFTYAVICPVIVPFGMLYFGFSLIVYKKQILYVYQPVYESGGAMFPGALQKTLFGLTCGQLTFIGYLFTRGFFIQAIFLMPLPVATLWGMSYFNQHYAKPSTRLSLERAREYDRVSEWLARNKLPSAKKAGEETLGSPMDQVGLASSDVEYGIEGRRAQFDKDSYRQPVLTQRPLKPKNYRRGQSDLEAEKVRKRLRELQEGYDLMEDNGAESSSGLKMDSRGGPATIPEEPVTF